MIQRARHLRPIARSLRTYTTAPAATPKPISSPQDVLDTALPRVSTDGWEMALTSAINDSGLSGAASSIFPRGHVDLVLHFLDVRCAKLKDTKSEVPNLYGRVLELVHARLLANTEIGQPQLAHALRLLANPKHFPASIKRLGQLSDEIWFLAGDKSTDGAWYTRRASLATIYAASEAFMARDSSVGFKDTLAVARRQLVALEKVETVERDILRWAKFNLMAGFNVARSLMR